MPGTGRLLIRSEELSDRDRIAELTRRAFAGLEFSDGSEPEIIERLRATGGLAMSLLAILDDRIVGHVAFSPASCADSSSSWFALGPISVEPSMQRQGIGSALVRAGLEALKRRNARGCILVGDPAYYGRFGFQPAPGHCPPGISPSFFMVARFDASELAGWFEFHPAFNR